MEKHETEAFCDYEVYEIVNKEIHYLCCTKEYNIAATIATLLAKADPTHDKYYVSNVSVPNTFVPGGGWYDCFYTDEEGNLHKDSLS